MNSVFKRFHNSEYKLSESYKYILASPALISSVVLSRTWFITMLASWTWLVTFLLSLSNFPDARASLVTLLAVRVSKGTERGLVRLVLSKHKSNFLVRKFDVSRAYFLHGYLKPLYYGTTIIRNSYACCQPLRIVDPPELMEIPL